MLPQAEWISTKSTRGVRPNVLDMGISRGYEQSSPQADASPAGSTNARSDDSCAGKCEQLEHIVAHRGSGGLVRGRAMFCLPPGGGWFQGHFAYASSGQALASLGVLGTELPVDPVRMIWKGGDLDDLVS